MKQFFETETGRANSNVRRYAYCPYCGAALAQAESGPQAPQRCPQCGFTPYYNPAPGVVVLIERDGQVLLGKRGRSSFQPGTWCLPGGFMEFDENFLQAAHREVMEETGLQVEIQAILNVTSNFLSEQLHTLVVVLLAQPLSGAARPGDDLVELGWFPLAGPFPALAFEADEYILQVYAAGHPGLLQVDERYRRG